ncbi:hypothetical protein, partial [Bacillus toyonensis]|uniref:hypothetical protein n=1 Tax=Bacillus toyonensis TaxID=155322 RepID=UPI000C025B2C
VKAIAVTARETGVITERDGTWSMTGTTIWNDRLRGAAGRLTMMVSDSEYAALYALALAGHSSIDAVLETIDETTLTTL